MATAVILAVAAFLSALGIFGDAVQAPCALMPQVSLCPALAPQKPPKLNSYTSDWVGGGHNRAEYCEPRKHAYQIQYSDFVIGYTDSEESDKDWKGHATYGYSCLFSPRHRKPRRTDSAFSGPSDRGRGDRFVRLTRIGPRSHAVLTSNLVRQFAASGAAGGVRRAV